MTPARWDVSHSSERFNRVIQLRIRSAAATWGGGERGALGASRGAAPAPLLFIRACSARVFFALPDWNSLRDRRCRWQTSCDMSAAVRALRTRQLTSHLTRIHQSAGISSQLESCF